MNFDSDPFKLLEYLNKSREIKMSEKQSFNEKFWIIVTNDGVMRTSSPLRSFEDAIDAASRLANSIPDVEYIVMESMTGFVRRNVSQIYYVNPDDPSLSNDDDDDMPF